MSACLSGFLIRCKEPQIERLERWVFLQEVGRLCLIMVNRKNLNYFEVSKTLKNIKGLK